MSNRRRPNATRDHASGPRRRDDPDASAEAGVDADAAALGFADLADGDAEHSVVPEFRNLRARLFGDFDVDSPTADLELLPSPPSAETHVRRQAGFTFGLAPTAADLAGASVDAPEEPDAEPNPGFEAELEERPDAEPGEVPGTADPLPESAVVDGHAVEQSAPPPVLQHPTPEPATQEASLVPTSAPVLVDEPSRRPAALYVALTAAVVAALLGGWLLLRSGDDQPAAEGRPPLTSASVRATSSAVTEIDDQSVRTRQQLDFDRAVSTLVLTVPRGDVEVGTADFDPEVTAIEISVPGEPAQSVDGDLLPGDTTSVRLDKQATTFELSYTASGTVVRTEPSSAHRAKALVTSLTVMTGEGSTSTFTVEGDDILNLGCTDPGATVACGEQADGGWSVTPTSATTEVIAQVDLPD